MSENFEKVAHTFFTGKTTCASERGKFCPFLFSKAFGTKYMCILFNVTLFENNNMCLVRCKECVDKLDVILNKQQEVV